MIVHSLILIVADIKILLPILINSLGGRHTEQLLTKINSRTELIGLKKLTECKATIWVPVIWQSYDIILNALNEFIMFF